MRPDHPRPFYYLDNFRLALDWIAQRYGDLLLDEEQRFLDDFAQLPNPAQAMLVRMMMRKGELFRHGKLRYEEIGDTTAAVAPLIALGWLDAEPQLSLAQLFGLLTKPELALTFAAARSAQRKLEQLASLAPLHPEPRSLRSWSPQLDDLVYRLTIRPLLARLQWMFFGNARQDWSEFVLADLAILVYEPVAFPADARGFSSRAQLDFYAALLACRQRLDEGECPAIVLADVQTLQCESDWLRSRRGKLLFTLAQALERTGQFYSAMAAYRDCNYPGAAFRLARVLEQSNRHAEAQNFISAHLDAGCSEQDRQQLDRLRPRLARRLGLPHERPTAPTLPKQSLCLPRPTQQVELAVRDHLHQATAPVHYVENLLLNGLFGLLCWPAIFAPLPGAFFHPFQTGPADLGSPHFHSRRQGLFDDCLAELDNERYRATIPARFRAKQGIQNPFVHWPALNEDLLALALHCIPAAHLGLIFRRMLQDLPGNRAGLPDLVQFWPAEQRYALIEVKGPGDRLQDNQTRWLRYFLAHGVEVQVYYVSWLE
ncbi:VRR-NUC domain-containing protein [Chitinimonas arctica]|uniref:phosphodiesterase I n=1 Tax=Chitinimonas arctica TaxID=2594795 RepID=A0A516SHQ1_9NEIS|nr:VRR-NUC domain-containing protein [Chitinimonas arctica]QDQ27673.1 VRR-NUC domain-containing protein [Chitinimonas arctica]